MTIDRTRLIEELSRKAGSTVTFLNAELRTAQRKMDKLSADLEDGDTKKVRFRPLMASWLRCKPKFRSYLKHSKLQKLRSGLEATKIIGRMKENPCLPTAKTSVCSHLGKLLKNSKPGLKEYNDSSISLPCGLLGVIPRTS